MRSQFYRLLLQPRLTALYDRWQSGKQAGPQGELFALRYLLKHGFIIIEQGYQDRYGEIDLIAVDDTTIVFVEVKTRSTGDEHPAEAVDEAKQRRISEAAKRYCKKHQLVDYPVRFDVIAIVVSAGNQGPQIEHFVSAFDATANFQLY